MKKGGYSCLSVLELSPQVGFRLLAVLWYPRIHRDVYGLGWMICIMVFAPSILKRETGLLAGWLVGWSSRHTWVDSSIVSWCLSQLLLLVLPSLVVWCLRQRPLRTV